MNNDTCTCGHPAADHGEFGIACAGTTEIAPGVAEWCQCAVFTTAPAGTGEVVFSAVVFTKFPLSNLYKEKPWIEEKR